MSEGSMSKKPMNKESMDNMLEHKAKIAFEQQTQSLDSKTLHRLRIARETALSKNPKPLRSSLSLKWLTGVGAGLALAGVLTFMVAPSLMPSSSSSDFLALDELELMTAEGDMDLVAQLDFYQWIDDASLSE